MYPTYDMNPIARASMLEERRRKDEARVSNAGSVALPPVRSVSLAIVALFVLVFV